MVLMDIQFSLPTIIQHLSNIEAWLKPDIGVWQISDFDFQLKFNVYPFLKLKCQDNLGFDINLIFISNFNLMSK